MGPFPGWLLFFAPSFRLQMEFGSCDPSLPEVHSMLAGDAEEALDVLSTERMSPVVLLLLRDRGGWNLV